MAYMEDGQTVPPGQYAQFITNVIDQLSPTVSPNANTQGYKPPPTADPSTPGGLVWPSTKTNLSGYHYSQSHHGIDIGQNIGDPIIAPFSGTVVFAGWDNTGYGNLVVIKDAAGRYRSYEAHLSEIFVKAGETVTAGMQIGAAGSTGNSTGPHLHFELRNADGTGYIDPYAVFGHKPEPGQVIAAAPYGNLASLPGATAPAGQTGNNNPFVAPPSTGNQTGTGTAAPGVLEDPTGTKGIWLELKDFLGRVRWVNIGAVILGLAIAALGVAVIVKSEGQSALGSAVGSAIGSAVAGA